MESIPLLTMETHLKVNIEMGSKMVEVLISTRMVICSLEIMYNKKYDKSYTLLNTFNLFAKII